MPAWPSNLPFFDVAEGGFTLPGSNVLVAEMSVGPARRRRRTSIDIPILDSKTPLLDGAQADQVRAFFRDDLASGALSFTAENAYTGQTDTFRFLSGITEQAYGLKRQFTATLEILP